MLRLDRLLTSTGAVSRKEAALAVRRGEVSVNGVTVRDPAAKVDETVCRVTLRGQPVTYRHYVYVMLNKPDGYISATEDGRGEPVVTDLLPREYAAWKLFPCGRLDKHTLGLMLLTNDGVLSHRLRAQSP